MQSSNALLVIQCPACMKGQISIEPKVFMQGINFSCSTCHASVCLPANSQMKYKSVLGKLEEIKSGVKK